MVLEVENENARNKSTDLPSHKFTSGGFSFTDNSDMKYKGLLFLLCSIMIYHILNCILLCSNVM